MITKTLLEKLRSYGYSDTDISEKITQMGFELHRTSIWRQRTKEYHSRAYPYLEKLIKKHERKMGINK